MEISENIDCTFCNKVYEVIIHEDEDEKSERVQFCSYCGEIIELSEEDDDNWDTLITCRNRLFINKSSNNRMLR